MEMLLLRSTAGGEETANSVIESVVIYMPEGLYMCITAKLQISQMIYVVCEIIFALKFWQARKFLGS